MDFVTLLNRGHKSYIEKYLKPRKNGTCDDCECYALLISTFLDSDIWNLCEKCYSEVIKEYEF